MKPCISSRPPAHGFVVSPTCDTKVKCCGHTCSTGLGKVLCPVWKFPGTIFGRYWGPLRDWSSRTFPQKDLQVHHNKNANKKVTSLRPAPLFLMSADSRMTAKRRLRKGVCCPHVRNALRFAGFDALGETRCFVRRQFYAYLLDVDLCVGGLQPCMGEGHAYIKKNTDAYKHRHIKRRRYIQ